MKSIFTATCLVWSLLVTAPCLGDNLDDVRFSSEVENFAGDADYYEVSKAHAADCECCGGALWTASADAVFMQRSRPDSLVLMRDVFDPTRNLNANAFDFDYQLGWDVGVERRTAHGGLEARLLSIDGWDAATTAIVGAPTLVRINNQLPFTLPSVSSIRATYNSELFSAEVNARRQLRDRLQLLAGLRYVELDEHFHADADAAAIPTTYDTWTRNRMYGVQVGAEATLWCRDRLTVEGLLKTGIYQNNAGHQTVLDTGTSLATTTDTADRTAFLGELAFTANYCVSQRIALRAGYNLLWLETVALASDQIPATHPGLGTGISADGGVFYHGGFVGVEFQR